MTSPRTSWKETLVGRVLVALDEIAVSERVIDWVRMILPEARLVLGRVVEPAYVPMGSLGLAYVPYPNRRVEKSLERLSKRVDPHAAIVLREGFPASSLREIATDSGCDLIALVTRGGSEAHRRFIGGTVEHLLHESKLPLLVIPATEASRKRKPRLKRILVPLDGEETSERILPLIRPVARRHRSLVMLVHCRKKGNPEDAKAPLNRLRTLASDLREPGVRTKSVVMKGDFIHSLGRVIATEAIDLVAMSVFGHGALRHLLFGAKASRILQTSTVPVLVVRHDAISRTDQRGADEGAFEPR